MASEEMIALNRKMRDIDPNPTRADGYIHDERLGLRVIRELLAKPWPGIGEPRLDLRWGYTAKQWEVLVYDFTQDVDPGDGQGARPYFHQTFGMRVHQDLAVAVCLAATALVEWRASKGAA